jgi:hypothetical protein
MKSVFQPSAQTIAGRYEVESLLGQGGVGCVYAVRDRTSGKRLALKQLAADAKPFVAQLFEREYQTLAGLRHPRIVEVYEYARDGASAFYTMELLTGADLSAAAPMAWPEVCRALSDVATILGVLHARRLVHRDLTPRNLWRTLDGRLKLLDFGALTPFGPCAELLGTPPFVPPEALRERVLDQRADLYALGALAYWLSSGVHAFPAKSLAELPRFWDHEPVSFAQLAKLTENPALAEIPEGLEALVRVLLRLDPEQRPGSAAEVIERLGALVELPADADQAAVEGYLQSPTFVARAREQQVLHEAVREASEGKVRALFVEGLPGIGRSRLLEEFAVGARIMGSLSVKVTASAGSAPYAVSVALLEQLLQACPELAQQVIRPHAPVLARLSTSVRDLLSAPQERLQVVGQDLRARQQAALADVVLQISRVRPLLLVVDDLHAADEESQALLAVLARSEPGAKLCLVASATRESGDELSAAVQGFRQAATRLHLVPLSSSETLVLLRSVFGQAPYLERLAERLHRLSDGNPAHCVELAQQLVQSGAARFAQGSWELPKELSSANLSRTRDEAALRRLSGLSAEERWFAACSSVPRHGEFTEDLCLAAAGSERAHGEACLASLQRKAVLVRTGHSVRFAHEAMREQLLGELSLEQRAQVHRRLAAALLGAETAAGTGIAPLTALRAAVHLLRAGELVEGERLLRDAARYFMDNDPELLRTVAPMLEVSVEILRAHQRDDYALALPLAVLCFAGYYVDRRYAQAYGDGTLSLLEQILQLPRARRLARFLGARFGLLVSLLVAGVKLHRRRAYAPTLRELVRALLGTATTLAGTAAVCLDGPTAERCRRTLEPLTGFGPFHAASVVYTLCKGLALRSREQVAETAKITAGVSALLASSQPIEGMPDDVRKRYLAGSLVSLGISESWRDADKALAIADRLEQAGDVYALSADQLRMAVHASRGNMEQAVRYRQRVDVHALRLGSAWQVETWASADALKTALLTHDVLAMKRAAKDLTRLSAEIPSLGSFAHSAEGAYLIMRGKYAEAVRLLDRDVEPLSVIGWGRKRGLFARALNGVGDHARAEQVCLDAIRHLDPEDFDFALLNVSLLVEHARAEAGLGKWQSACERLDRLIARHADSQGALIAGCLYEARAVVALEQGDFEGSARFLAQMEASYRPTGIQSLGERVEQLRRRWQQATGQGSPSQAPIGAVSSEAQLITRVQMLLSHTAPRLAERARRALQITMELTAADAGFLVLLDSREALAHLGAEAPDTELLSWAKTRLELACANDETAAVMQTETLIDVSAKIAGDLHYCVAPLWTVRDRMDVAVAAVALGFRHGSPRLPGPEVLRAIAAHLSEVTTQEHSLVSA